MTSYNFTLSNKKEWKNICKKINNLDFYYNPEFHNLYKLRYINSEPNAWVFSKKDKLFLYTFNLTQVLSEKMNNKNIYDISSTYGFLGPVSNSNDEDFISEAWIEFDKWALKKNIILEFIRFNPLLNNHEIRHKDTSIEFNRFIAVSNFENGTQHFDKNIPSKTKNMIRKAKKNNFKTKKIDFKKYYKDFYSIYRETMSRNNAQKFFQYDLNYFNLLSNFDETKFYGIFDNNKLIAGGIFFLKSNIASYHLGACKKEYLKFGLSNLYLYDASIDFCKKGVKFLNLGGGRTTDKEDSLLKFKRDNSTELRKFFIGKRILNNGIYDYLGKKFAKEKKNNNNLIFYRN